MKIDDICPFVRLARAMHFQESTRFFETVCLDARLFFVTEGEGEIIVRKEAMTLSRNDVLILPAGTAYSLGTPSPTCSYLALNFDFHRDCADQVIPVPPVAVSEYAENMLIAPVSFEDGPEFNAPLLLTDMPELRLKLAEVTQEYSLRLLGHSLRASSLTADILLACLRRKRSLDNEGHKRRVQEILSYIHSRANTSLTYREVAEEFHYHPNYVAALVRQAVGVPFHRYLIEIRIYNAIALMDTTDMSLTDIAEAVGFCDGCGFSRHFRDVVGVTPQKYRRRSQTGRSSSYEKNH